MALVVTFHTHRISLRAHDAPAIAATVRAPILLARALTLTLTLALVLEALRAVRLVFVGNGA
jgi:hypothetical protein